MTIGTLNSIARDTLPKALAIVDEVCAAHGIGVVALMGAQRAPHLIDARVDAIVRLRESLSLSFPQIGVVLQRDHTTVLHHYQKAAAARPARKDA